MIHSACLSGSRKKEEEGNWGEGREERKQHRGERLQNKQAETEGKHES